MAFADYPSRLIVKTLDSGESIRAGGFTVGADQQLAHLVLTLFVQGASAITQERLRLSLYHDAELTKLYATGTWFKLKTISNLRDGTYWIGRVPFTFTARPQLEAVNSYYVKVESDRYTRVGNSSYLACVLDWPLSINANEDIPHYACAMEIYGERRV